MSRIIQQWGKLPLMLLSALDLKQHRYAYVGTEDWSMYPVLYPGSLLLLDESLRKVQQDTWSDEYERPIYFVEYRDGFACGYCSTVDNVLVLQPHSGSMAEPRIFKDPSEVDVIGTVCGVAMRLDLGQRRRIRF